MLREIVRIDDEKCTGCGVCVPDCHEGAITIESREAEAYDEVAVIACPKLDKGLDMYLQKLGGYNVIYLMIC